MAAALRGGGRGLRRCRTGRAGPGRDGRSSGRPTASGSWRRWAGPPRTRPAWWRRGSASDRGGRAGRADGLVHRRQQPAGTDARRLPRHLPGRARRRAGHRGRGHVRPRPGPPGPGPALAGMDQPAGGDAAGRTLRGGEAGRHRARDAARRPAAGPRLPPVRERAAGRQRLDAARSTGRASAACGRASARWRPPTPTRGSARPGHPTRSSRRGPTNRMVSFPYPKLCTANMQVDQGAAFIVCSAAAARAAGVPEERWVFPLAGADGNDHWFISERPELHRSPAIRLAGAAALRAGRAGHRRHRLGRPLLVLPRRWCRWRPASSGLALDDPDRPLTLTGGLTFGGGPGNNYTSHGIAQAVGALRERTGQRGARQRPGLVRHQALPGGLRLPPAGPRRQPALRLAQRAAGRRRAAALRRRRRRAPAPSASRPTP